MVTLLTFATGVVFGYAVALRACWWSLEAKSEELEELRAELAALDRVSPPLASAARGVDGRRVG